MCGMPASQGQGKPRAVSRHGVTDGAHEPVRKQAVRGAKIGAPGDAMTSVRSDVCTDENMSLGGP
jgi:hypothetical protein